MKVALCRRHFLATTSLATLGVMAWPLPARPEPGEPAGSGVRRALLVAVTAYPDLPPRNELTGTNNDVTFVREWLLAHPAAPFRPDDITVLADDLPVADAPPTLMQIRDAMRNLARQVEAGDTVYLHFSGHGHHQPSSVEGEVGGQDEVFLPRDAGLRRRPLTEWPNGYVDKQIKADIDAIRARGAFVWAVFDCCHAATITRSLTAGEGGERIRRVDLTGVEDYAGLDEVPRARNLADSLPPRSMLDLGDAPAAAPGTGGLVAFFASQSDEPTFELPMPLGAEQQVHMGLFTHTLLTRVIANPFLTYRQLGEAVLQSYTAMQRARPVPMFEGDEAAMNTRVFGVDRQDYRPQWPLLSEADGFVIGGGSVHGLLPGARLLVLADPGHADDQALGYMTVAEAGPTRAVLDAWMAPVANHDGAGGGDLSPPRIEAPPAGAWVRMGERPIDLEMTLALPPEGRAEAAHVGAMMRALAAEPDARFRLRLVAAGQPADLHVDILSRAEVLQAMQDQDPVIPLPAEVTAAGDRTDPELWLLGANREISLWPARVPLSLNLVRNTGDEQVAWLRDTLTRAYRATTLVRLADSGALVASGDVEITAELRRAAGNQELRAHRITPAMPDDVLWIGVQNNAGVTMDVHALFVGSDFSITPSGRPERLRPGRGFQRGQFRITNTSIGREHLVVVLSEASDQSPRLDLGFLAQDGAVTRGLGQTAFRNLLDDIGEAASPRGGAAFGGGDEPSRGAVVVFSLDTVSG